MTHTLHADVRHGKANVTADVRETAKRSTVWSKATYSARSTKRVKPPKNEIIPSGDPFVAFRRAYREGTLRDLGGGRYEVPFPHVQGGGVVYDIDPRTGRPLRLTVTTDQPAMPELGRPAVRSKTVLTFSVYERLPVTKANRKLLAILPHPGPGTAPASEFFAALRTGTPPDAATLKILGVHAKEQRELGIDLDGARALADDVWLLPGKGYVCLVAKLANGSGASCQAIRVASRNGISMGSPDRFIIAVPDGVKAVRARANARRPWRSYPVENGLVRLPRMGYAWRLVR